MKAYRLVSALVLASACLGLADQAGAQAFRTRRHEPELAERKPTEKAFPFDVTWVLHSLDDRPVASSDPPTFSIDATLRARGFAGCNTYSMALYPIKNQTLASGAIATTRKACEPAVMAAERAFLVALHTLPHWQVTPEGDLLLQARGTALRFRHGL